MRLDGKMHEGIFGREKVFEAEWKSLEELFGEIVRDPS